MSFFKKRMVLVCSALLCFGSVYAGGNVSVGGGANFNNMSFDMLPPVNDNLKKAMDDYRRAQEEAAKNAEKKLSKADTVSQRLVDAYMKIVKNENEYLSTVSCASVIFVEGWVGSFFSSAKDLSVDKKQLIVGIINNITEGRKGFAFIQKVIPAIRQMASFKISFNMNAEDFHSAYENPSFFLNRIEKCRTSREYHDWWLGIFDSEITMADQQSYISNRGDVSDVMPTGIFMKRNTQAVKSVTMHKIMHGWN